jgi:hypothetical protein
MVSSIQVYISHLSYAYYVSPTSAFVWWC